MIHLHRHSEFSRLDGVGTAQQYADRAVEIEQGALGQTDHGTLSGALHHIDACRKAGILPITGVEAYFRPIRGSKFTRQAWHLCLFAKNLKGWHSLLRLVSKAYAPQDEGGGFYQYPCVDWELLESHSEGIACSSACISSWLSGLIDGGDSVAVTDYLDRMLRIYGDDFWLEIMPHDFDDQRTLNLEIVRLAQERGIPLLATNDVHFPYKEWAETQKMAKMMGAGITPDKAKKLSQALDQAEVDLDHALKALEMAQEPKEVKKAEKKVESAKKKVATCESRIEKFESGYLSELNPTLYLAHEEEIRFWFERNHSDLAESVVDEAIKNTDLFVQRTTPYLLDKTDKLPKVTKSAEDSERILWEWIDEGLNRLYARWERDGQDADRLDLEYRARVDSEFAVLKNKGVLDYFVMVGEVCRWAKSQGIRIGLGRGSAAGCLISYLIGIVQIDPIPYGLLFERFLNPGRKGLPDIDLDFQSDRRHEVKAFIAERYGEDHVADIITHSRFQPKSVIQDLCRVNGVPYMEAHALTDTIEIRQDDEETTLEELLPLNDKLQEFAASYPTIWDHALRLEGTVKNAGKHAAGIIITPRPIQDYMALERGKKGDLVTSWSDAADFPVVSDHGFVKIDALGIKGLEKHDYACKLIKRRTGEEVDLYALPALYDPHDVDEEVMEGFRKGYTIGVFQFGGRGITNLLRDIQPDSILDLTAANALYRPGPMKGGVTWDYADRKNAEGGYDIWHESVEPVLSETYGLVAYQEQVMEIAKRVGGFTSAEADDLRKAMGKLYRIKGGTAARDFMAQYEAKWFEGAERNGIDKKTADEIWHKILQFGSYGFNKSHSASYALQAYQDMYLKMKYPLEFYAAFLTHEEDEDKRMIAIREARTRGIEILPPSVQTSGIGWTVDEEVNGLRVGLVAIKDVGDVGAAAIIKERAHGEYESVEDFRARIGAKAINAKAMTALTESGAFDCFGARDEASGKEIAAWEKDRLNMSLTVAGDIQKHADLIRENIYTQDEVNAADKGNRVIVGGEVAKVERKKTKNGKPFANVTIIFEMNEWRVKFWEKQLIAAEDILIEGEVVMVAGTKDEWNGFVSVIAQNTTDLESFAASVTATA